MKCIHHSVHYIGLSGLVCVICLFIFAVVVSAEMNCSPLLISFLLRVQAHQGVHFNKGIFDEY